MALAEKYVILFQRECNELCDIVIHNLKLLSKNPKDTQSLEKMLQAADTIIGDSRFIKNKELEVASTLLVETFSNFNGSNQKSNELKFFIEMFTKIKNH